MPRKPGIFKLHQQEILGLISKGIGYTQIAEIFHDKYGIKVTKQNLEQSHKRYLKEQSKKKRKKSSPKVSDKSHKTVPPKASEVPTKKYPEEALESIVHTPEAVAETLSYRERLLSIQLELDALIDAEANSGRFSGSQVELLRGWSKALFAQDPDAAITVYRDTFGSDLLGYMNAFEGALKCIYAEGKYRAHETRARPADEEILLMFMEMEREQKERRERELLMAQALRDKAQFPELYEGVEINLNKASKGSSEVPKTEIHAHLIFDETGL